MAILLNLFDLSGLRDSDHGEWGRDPGLRPKMLKQCRRTSSSRWKRVIGFAPKKAEPITFMQFDKNPPPGRAHRLISDCCLHPITSNQNVTNRLVCLSFAGRFVLSPFHATIEMGNIVVML
jgi:hypothetical protein